MKIKLRKFYTYFFCNYRNYLQIKKTLNDYNLKNTDCIFFDDTQKHINKCYDKGINSVLVKKGIGIDKKCLNIFKKTFKIKINKDKIIY